MPIVLLFLAMVMTVRASLPVPASRPSIAPAGPFEHAVFESVSLDGAWEMSYRPFECRTVECPAFRGVRIAQAIPGYWEDMVPAFRAAGMTDEFCVMSLLFGELLVAVAAGAAEPAYVSEGLMHHWDAIDN